MDLLRAALGPLLAAAALAATGLHAQAPDAGPDATHSPRPDGGPVAAGEEPVPVTLKPGDRVRLAVPAATQVVCDDPAVAYAENTERGTELIAAGAGRTICGARFAGAQRGLWKVTVAEARR